MRCQISSWSYPVSLHVWKLKCVGKIFLPKQNYQWTYFESQWGDGICGILRIFRNTEGILNHQVKERAKLVLHVVQNITVLMFNTTSIYKKKKKKVNISFLLLSFYLSLFSLSKDQIQFNHKFYLCMVFLCYMHKIKIHH